MTKSKAISVIVHESEPEQVIKVLIAYGEMQQTHQRLKILFQAAQGVCLLRLQEQYGFTRGGDRKLGAPIKTADCGFDSWPEFVKATFGFSDDKALRLINQGKATGLLVEKLGHADQQRVADFLRRPMLHLTTEELKALEKVTNKIATLQDEIDEAAEAKFLRKPHGHGLLKDHDKSKKSAPAKVDPDLEFHDQLLLPLGVEKGDGTVKTIWSQFDAIYEAWNKPVKIGNSKIPLWQTGDHAKRRKLIAEVEKQKALINQKLDDMLAQAKEALKS